MDYFSDGSPSSIMRLNGVSIVALAIVLIATAVAYLRSKRLPDDDIYVDGFVDPEFENVREAFKENFARGWERDGAAIAVFHHGKLVVDLWGGYADKQSERRWSRDTMSIAFSSTKAVASLCIALLVDRGHVKYEQKIIEFWPQFGKHGKDVITVNMIMSHTAGLAHLDEVIHYEDALNPERMAEIIENQVPHWTPGDKTGYHAVAFGWIVDQIVRRTDPEHRSIGTFFREEIAEKYDIDFHIGLPLEQAHRVARLRRPTAFQRFDEFLSHPMAVNYLHILQDVMHDGFLTKMLRNPDWLQGLFRLTLNNPELFILEQPAALGIGTARSLAKIFDIMLKGDILSPNTLKRVIKPITRDYDIVTGITLSRGHGWTFLKEKHENETFEIIGHAGFGGQNVRFDPNHNLAFAFLSNGLKNGLGNSARTYVPVKDAILQSVGRLSKSVSS